jgi:hypothetical protein
MPKVQKFLCVFFTIYANSENVLKVVYSSQRIHQNNLTVFRKYDRSLYADKVNTPSEMDPAEIRLIRKVVIKQRGVKFSFFISAHPPSCETPLKLHLHLVQ